MKLFMSYRLDDLLLFSPEVYYSSLAYYNDAIWPAQIVAFFAGLLFFWLCYRRQRKKLGFAGLLLGLGWGWCGLVYHHQFYQGLNWMAFYYGWLFVVQALLLSGWGVWQLFKVCAPVSHPTQLDCAGLAVIGLALFALPFTGLVDGPSLKGGLVLGLSPAPTLLATAGFALITPRAAWWLFILPILYAVIGITTAYVIGSWQLAAYLTSLLVVLFSLSVRLKRRSSSDRLYEKD